MRERKTGRQEEKRAADPDETDFEEMLERYTMVPPSPYLLKKKRRKRKKTSVHQRNQ